MYILGKRDEGYGVIREEKREERKKKGMRWMRTGFSYAAPLSETPCPWIPSFGSSTYGRECRILTAPGGNGCPAPFVAPISFPPLLPAETNPQAEQVVSKGQVPFRSSISVYRYQIDINMRVLWMGLKRIMDLIGLEPVIIRVMVLVRVSVLVCLEAWNELGNYRSYQASGWTKGFKVRGLTTGVLNSYELMMDDMMGLKKDGSLLRSDSAGSGAGGERGRRPNDNSELQEGGVRNFLGSRFFIGMALLLLAQRPNSHDSDSKERPRNFRPIWSHIAEYERA